MNPREKELMERYIYQVVRHLPREQRQEVSMELQELIGDMRETEPSMEAVLTKLGDPREFARKYQDGSRCLIGPEYFDTYIWLLKIVLVCTAVTVLIASAVQGFREGSVMNAAGGVGNLFSSCIGAFGMVTLLFALMERGKIQLDKKQETQWRVQDLGDNFAGGKKFWTPDYLSPIPHKKALISRGDCIVSIVFTVIFGILLIFAPSFFDGAFKNGEEFFPLQILNLAQWDQILPLFVLSLAIGLADDIFRLIAGYYNKAVMVSSIVCGSLQLILTFLALKVFPFWNPDFGERLKELLGDQMSPAASLFLEKWDGDLVSDALLVFFALVTAAEIGTAVYKTLRYGVQAEVPGSHR